MVVIIIERYRNGEYGSCSYSEVKESLISASKQRLSIGFPSVSTTVLFSILIAPRAIGLRVSNKDAQEGLDITTHGERGYHL